MSKRVQRSVKVINKLGLHARAATKLVQLANQHVSEITLIQDDQSAAASSVLALMMLESSQGKVVDIVCEGEDAEAAMQAIVELFENKFDESE